MLCVAERERLGAFALAKRRGDWLIGRLAAKEAVIAALATHGVEPPPPRAIEIATTAAGVPFARIAADGPGWGRSAPHAPLPVSLSISHSEGVAVAAARWRGSGVTAAGLGIDLEALAPRSGALVATFFSDRERAFVNAAPPGEHDLRANLVWCGKEAVLKALGLGLTVDTRSIECAPAFGEGRHDLAVAADDHAWHPLQVTVRLPEHVGVRAAWCLAGGYVVALAETRAEECVLSRPLRHEGCRALP